MAHLHVVFKKVARFFPERRRVSNFYSESVALVYYFLTIAKNTQKIKSTKENTIYICIK